MVTVLDEVFVAFDNPAIHHKAMPSVSHRTGQHERDCRRAVEPNLVQVPVGPISQATSPENVSQDLSCAVLICRDVSVAAFEHQCDKTAFMVVGCSLVV